MANWITIFTGLIAIWNFGYTFSHGMTGQEITVPSIPPMTMPFRFVLFILLETALAYAFGWFLVKLAEYGKGVPVIMIWTVSLISSWTSLFNIQWLLTGPKIDTYSFLTLYTLWFGLLSIIALIIALYFIENHTDDKSYINLTSGIQSSCFLLMFFMYLFGS